MSLEKAKSLVRGVLFWPNMNANLNNFIESCQACLKYHRQNTKEPLVPHEIPTLPWYKIGADFFDFDNKKYLVIMDYLSKFIELIPLNSSTAAAVIDHFKITFSRHGITNELVTDSGPPWDSYAFKEFTKLWEFKHVKSSPYHSQSNGQAESAVKICKNIFRKCKESGTDPRLALLHYQNTPKDSLEPPSTLLMSRRLKCVLPIIPTLLKPKFVNIKHQRKILQHRQSVYKHCYDRSVKPLSNLIPGQSIYFRKTPISNWLPGKIVKVLDSRTYLIENSEGSTYRRNRKFIIPQPESILKETVSSDCQNNLSFTIPFTPAKSHEQVIKTKSGRIIKPPRRFTFSDYK